ncbi:MAG: hypothetical protein JWN73_2729 [Betaproteobacteria bacterium]|nr:hypothetical protein [Betaproteobacteria bacterium]
MKAGGWRNLACLALASCAMTAAAQTPQDEKWVRVVQPGVHVLNGGTPVELLEVVRARHYFAGDFLLHWPVPADAEPRRAQALAELRRREPRLIAGGDPRPFGVIERFSHGRVGMRVELVLGASGRERYFYGLARYEMARDPAIDAALGLPQLERKLAFVYQSLGYGSSAPELFARLGPADQELAGQAPSQRNLYFARHDLHVEIHQGVVYYLEHGKPGWLSDLPPVGAGPMHGPAPVR